MADKKKEYLIGDVSRIVGLSRDALRFYSKKEPDKIQFIELKHVL